MAKKKNDLLARIVYVSGEDDNEGREGFMVESSNDGGKTWGMDTFYYLHKSAKFPDADEANFLSWSILDRIVRLEAWGYHLEIRGREIF